MQPQFFKMIYYSIFVFSRESFFIRFTLSWIFFFLKDCGIIVLSNFLVCRSGNYPLLQVRYLPLLLRAPAVTVTLCLWKSLYNTRSGQKGWQLAPLCPSCSSRHSDTEDSDQAGALQRHWVRRRRSLKQRRAKKRCRLTLATGLELPVRLLWQVQCTSE
jgi:hypothetical protein